MRLFIVGMAVAMVCGAAYGLEVPLTVAEPLGAARANEVASGGIPFPEGACKDAAGFSLYDGSTEIPVQVSPIVKYPDGSLHWALVSIPVSLQGMGKKTFVLKDSPGKAAPTNPVVVKEDGDTVEVSNGIVAFAVNRKSFNGFEWIKYKDKEIFKAATAGLAANGKGGPCTPILFDFTYRGPIITTLSLKGTYGDQKTPTWSMRISLRVGESRIHIEHNLRNGGLGVKKIQVSDAKLCLGLSGELKDSGGGAAKKAGKRGPAYGWKEFTGATDLTVFIRHGGKVSGKGGIMFEAAVEDGELVVDLGFVKGTAVALQEGCHKLSEIDLVFGSAFTTDALAEPLHARAPCSWYADHDGLAAGVGFGSLEDETQTYKNAGWTKADDPKKMPKRNPDPTLYKNSMKTHETSECDQLLGLTLGYVRTGQRGYLDAAMAWARYWRSHYMYRTDEFTYGKEGRQGKPKKFGSDRTCAGGCHTYGLGIFGLALITGNIDMLESAFEIAEQCNGTAGTYSKLKPGSELAFWGYRSFIRNYHPVIRAYDVARTKEWEERAIYMVKLAAEAVDRDPRGFINHGVESRKPENNTVGRIKKWIAKGKGKGSMTAAMIELQEKEGTTFAEKLMVNPKYGSWPLKHMGSWPAAMAIMAYLDAYRVLSASENPEAQLAGETARDMGIAASRLGYHYMYNTVQHTVPSYMHIDYPIPGYVPTWKGGKWDEYIAKGATDSWYTKWWPSPMAAGYKLTGDEKMYERMQEVLWWALARNWMNSPTVAEGEAPPYARVSTNTKGDWMTPTALAFGVGARPRKDKAAPAAISDLSAVSEGGGTVKLSWTAPKDEGGTVDFYQVKWGELPLDDYPVDGEYWRKNWKDGNVTVTYWNMANNVPEEPKPQSAGSKETMTLEVPAGKTLYAAVRSFDDSHNRSTMSNVVSVEVK